MPSAQLTRLIERATTADGAPPFSDGSLLALGQGNRELVWEHDTAAAILSVGEHEAEFVVDPDARGRGHGTAILETLLSRSHQDLRVWAHGDHAAARALAASHGLRPTRELLNLARSLEVGPADPARPADRTHPENLTPTDSSQIRAFRVGVDEAAWVDLNGLIFATHHEQGAVSRADVELIEREPWFDATDFLLLWQADHLIGYCWLKVEGESGEFYVVGVHPDHQGEGLGGRLFARGLERLAERHVTRAHLYVEGDNAPALQLYRSRGFDTESIDVQYSTG